MNMETTFTATTDRQQEALNTEAAVTREYYIKGTRYLVTATARNGASQDAAAIVRRLIQKDVLDAVNFH